MTISYKWLSDYLPLPAVGKAAFVEPEQLSKILTSIGLEVESFHKYEEIKGGLKGLVIGQVISVEKHPNADKLKSDQSKYWKWKSSANCVRRTQCGQDKK